MLPLPSYRLDMIVCGQPVVRVVGDANGAGQGASPSVHSMRIRIDTQDYPMMVARPIAGWRLDGLAVRLVQRRVVDHHTALDQRTTVLLLLPQGDSTCVPPCGCRHRALDIRVGRQMESRCVSVAENVLRCDQNLDIV